MLTHQEAKRLATAHLRAEGSTLVAVQSSRDRRWPVWVVSYVEPERPDEPLMGGGLVVTDDGAVHGLGSAPGDLDLLMHHLGVTPEPGDAWEREGEGLALLADLDPDEAKELAEYADQRQRERREHGGDV